MEPEELPDVPDKILEHKTEELFSGNASLSTVFKHYEKKMFNYSGMHFMFLKT